MLLPVTWATFCQNYLIPSLVTLLSVAVPLLVAYFKMLTNKLQQRDAQQQKVIDANTATVIDLHRVAEATPRSPMPAPLPPAIAEPPKSP